MFALSSGCENLNPCAAAGPALTQANNTANAQVRNDDRNIRMGTKVRAPGPLQREDYANGTAKSTEIVRIPMCGRDPTGGATLRPSLLGLENPRAECRISAPLLRTTPGLRARPTCCQIA